MKQVIAYDDVPVKPPPQAERETPAEEYMSRSDVARYLGLKSVKSLSGVPLPPHDAMVGVHPGWSKSTIDTWIENRPGRGRWGARGSAAE